MKTKSLHLMLVALAALATGSLFAQDNDAKADKQKYSLHIIKDENGKTRIIDRTFGTKDEMDAFVKANDLDKAETDRPEPPTPPTPPNPPVGPNPPSPPSSPGKRQSKKNEVKEKKIIIIEKEEGGLNGKTGFTIDLSQLPEDEVIKVVQEIINLNLAKVEVQHIGNKKEINQAPASPRSSTEVDQDAQRTAIDPQPDANSANVANLKVYPNPGRQFHVVCNVSKPCDVKLTMVDMNGKEVYEEAMNNYSGKLEKDINGAALGKGTYLLDVEAGSERATTTVVLQ
jgi:hypothetical protein